MTYVHPVGDYPITDDYAAHLKRGSAEPGVDFATPTGTPAYAIADGVVTGSAYSPTRGYVIDVRFNDGSRGAYLHMSRLDVGAGSRVTRGQRVGLTGNTGASRGPHLHFTYWRPGNRGGYLNTDDFMEYYNASAAGGGGKDMEMTEEQWETLKRIDKNIQWLKDAIGGTNVGDKKSKTVRHMLSWLMDRVGGTYKGDNITEMLKDK